MRFYQRISLITVVSVYILILIGGIVRSTGAGMGCPDWPLCFDRVVPPFSESELPADYAERIHKKRVEKNNRFLSLLDKIGVSIQSESHSFDEVIRFNVTKAWIEYLNRLVGVLIGLFILLTAGSSVVFFKSKPSITILSFVAFVLVCIEGWLGSLVVSSNLLPGLITLHMLLALLIVILLLYGYVYANHNISAFSFQGEFRIINILIFINIVLMVAQLIMGTQVRESIDSIMHLYLDSWRMEWIKNIDVIFYVHRSFSLLVFGMHALLIYKIYKMDSLNWIAISLVMLVFIAILSGALMAYNDIPAFLQPIHLLVSNMIIGFQVYLCLFLNSNSKLTSTLKHV